ncbi:SRPBCC domain-containing protein [Paenibacillus sp. NEAU-GSW1]|uniref:SRPBCC domain-containing protein n=1 Tax=Paenibacillus sp. NEAU-GSW1 TaxID=2682486 RepID=UPI0012E32CF2|nr:SRPBCC domain-containing protein [Paenibacillus sp. NEAU-GSW1]MUT67793.1 SRPBCC domain-containing protein [Paenibacillus sp. NEAU-GSW1]
MFKKKEAPALKSKIKGNVLLVERVFDAPRELVFQAYSEAEHLVKWWGPAGWSLKACNVDFRAGGAWHYCLEASDEQTRSWGKSVYRDISVPDKIVYGDYVSDEDGSVNEDRVIIVTLAFAEEKGKTKLINRAEFVSSGALKRTVELGLVGGISQTWDRLAQYLRGIQTS